VRREAHFLGDQADDFEIRLGADGGDGALERCTSPQTLVTVPFFS
jgi:hypothetical protein